ncbi:MAG: sigma-70 family RNA polymerase sigma factor [Vicinamibacteria bacterium]
MDHETSSLLLRRAREGSREALETLFTECGDKLLALIRLRLGPNLRPHLESRDILQETLLLAFQHIDEFRGTRRKTLAAWLAAIACNQIRNEAEYLHRKRRDVARTVPLEGLRLAAAEVRSHTSCLSLREESQALERALDSMNEVQREVILLRNFEELTFPEMGGRLGKSADACRMLYARSMVALTNKVREPSPKNSVD